MRSTVALLSLGVLSANALAPLYGQCGGASWTGDTVCVAGATCVYSNDFYSQCLPSTASATSSSSSSKTTSLSTSTSTSKVTSASISTSTKPVSSSTTSKTTSASTSTSSAPATTGGPSRAVGKTPALGWNSWNAYRGDINQTKILTAANLLVSLGLKDAGYTYVNIDDCWSNITGRDAVTQRIKPDLNKFPSGIASLATTVHGLGLKLGIYGDEGTATCAGYPGSLGYEAIDAQTWSEWGVDYIKMDNCNVPGNWSDTWTYPDWYDSNSAKRYRQMTTALAAVAHPILYSICNWGNANVWAWGARVGHSWRLTGDSSASWSFITSSITSAVNVLDYVTFYGHGDMDMMEIGNGALTIQEQRSHFALWVALKSPILLGTDLGALPAASLAIVKNAELLAFHQDTTIGAPARPFNSTTSPPEYYAGLSSKGTHVFVLNTASSTASKTVTFSAVPNLASASSYKVHNMWSGADVGTFATSYTFSLDAHDTAAFLITPV